MDNSDIQPTFAPSAGCLTTRFKEQSVMAANSLSSHSIKSILDSDVKRYQDAAFSEATLRQYATHFRIFQEWCNTNGLVAMPPSPETVGAYLADQARTLSVASIRCKHAAICYAVREHGFQVDRDHPAIRLTLRGIARLHNTPQRQAEALMLDDIRKIVETCSKTRPLDIRDRAMILIWFAGALRRSEIVAIDAEHVSWVSDGIVLLIPKSKTDQKGEGHEIAIPHGASEETCPVRALRSWIDVAGIDQGPVFRRVRSGGVIQEDRLTDKAVVRAVQMRAEAVGVIGSDTNPISAHSLRSGFITQAYKLGVTDVEIMAHTRHGNAPAMRGYVRRTKLNGGSPAGRLGL